MTTTIEFGAIKRLQRAIFAQLHPLAGTRAFGQARFVATTLDPPTDPVPDITLPANTYLVPIVGGEALDHRIYKVAPNPDTITAGSLEIGQWSGGDWAIPEGDELLVNIQSNVGGAMQNLPAGTRLRLDPPVPGIEAEALVQTAITNGTDVHPLIGANLLKRLVFWQQMATPNAAAEFFKAGAAELPALLMIWLRSQTLQGRTSGGTQGNTRLGRGERAFRESFQIFVGGGSYESAGTRRDEALVAVEAATSLLSDQQNNLDMKPLSSMGAGVEITERALAVAGRDRFIYQFDFEVNQVVSKLELRTFGAWTKNYYQAFLPGRPAPEPTDDFQIVDAVDDMP